MRMWMIEPSKMCSKHLLGEHVELHMLVSHMNKGHKLDGFIAKGLVELDKIIERHDDIVDELKERGVNHTSILTIEQSIIQEYEPSKVNVSVSIEELSKRCTKCKEMIWKS